MIIKTQEEVLQEIMDRLRANTEISDLDPGTIARAFCDVMSEMFAQFYNELDLASTMPFVSTAEGYFLDMIGALLDCSRNSGESDTNYRTRIANQVYVVAGANQTSIRLRILSIGGVRNVIMRPYTHGTGSFSVYIVTDEPETPLPIINQVEDIVEDAKGYGIYTEVKSPALIHTELKARLIFSDRISDAEKSSIRQTAIQNIRTYIDSIGLGGRFTINQITHAVMSASSKIANVEIFNLKVNGSNHFVGDFSINWNERIVLDDLHVA